MRLLRLLLPAMAVLVPVPAMAACEAGKIVEFPVTMAGRQPLVEGKFGSKAARFILDSGAFYSTLSAASAAEFGLRVTPAPLWFRPKGIGGDTSAGVAVATNFSIAGVAIPKIDFVVGGSDTGTTGLIGQNILGLADVEYDLPHGVVRLIKTKGCRATNLAYWAGSKPVTIVSLETPQDTLFKPHTIGTVLLNGVKVRAMFDSGADSSMLSLTMAKRLGITPETPGVVSVGQSHGLGQHHVSTWRATFDSIDIGGEAIRHPQIEIGQLELGNADMLIGVDFFLTHRMFVSNTLRRLFITYEGGPVFGLSPKTVFSADGTALDLTNKAPEPTTADAYSRRGAVYASNQHLPEALADFDKACALAPTEARYFYQRAMAQFASRQNDKGMADLDKTIALDPTMADARLTRASMRIRRGNSAGANEDVQAADAALPPSSDKRLTVAGLFDALDRREDGLRNYDLWFKSHPEDSSRTNAFNGRCWSRGLLNRELDKALADCNAAVKGDPKQSAFLDSRALVRLRRGELRQALADYDAALALAPRTAWSLYMRGVTHKRMGNAAQAAADRAAALSIDPKVAERARKIGFDD
jgi:tetratricopeptide (TPR) repeat protein/predicted aspartyl protease